MAEITSALRLVPGAPPPIASSKSQRKKRKTGTKSKTPGSPAEGSVTLPDAPSVVPADSAPNETDPKEDNAAAEHVAPSEAPTHDDLNPKSSPIIELVQKRMRALNKKISRGASYAATDNEKLNDDQKRSVKTLPSLEAVYKELDDVKKLIEAHEAQSARDQALKRAELERIESLKVQEAISSAQESHASRTSSILTLLRLRSVFASGDVPPVALEFDDGEGSAIFTACDALLGEDTDLKNTTLSGFLSGEGDLNGVSYTRMLSIVQSFLNPPREPTPLPAEPEREPVETEVTPVDEPVAGIPGSSNASSSFHFMQASELETPTFENSTEWVEKPEEEDPNGVPEEQPQVVENVSVEPVETISTQPIDWADADEEGGLPSIANLQATFASSGSATPVVQTIEVNLPSSAPLLNGDASSPAPHAADDGFTPTHRGGRGRGRGHRGERGGGRGGFRGDRTSFHRGGERGGFRGGNRGDRGGDRAYRGNRSDGDWRNGDGENRGRGRGRSRGRGGGGSGERGGSGHQESHGAVPS